MSQTTFAAAIRDGLATAMEIDRSVVCYGLGVPDPKGVFGTTLGLQQRFGADRVFDMPTAENAMTGIGIGAAIGGLRPVLTHQRLDFALLSMDQIVNNAAKWRFMFGGKRGVPLTIRFILGRGWGQGPTHSQNLQAWFSHIPGLKVVMPTTPADAKGLLLSSIFDDDPVIFLEHRWLHNSKGEVPEGDHRIPFGRAARLRSGTDATVVSFSYGTVEALRAVDCLAAQGINCDLLDLRSLSPLDVTAISESVERTGRLVVVDTATRTGSFAGEIVAQVVEKHWSDLRAMPVRLTAPDAPEATSPALTRDYHVRAEQIAGAVARIMDANVDLTSLALDPDRPHDVPGPWFSGPF